MISSRRLYLKVGNQQKALLGSAKQALLIEPQLLPRHLQVIDLLFKQKEYEGASQALAEARSAFPRPVCSHTITPLP